MPSILITGTSSGYGLETARHFLAQGWNVIATMRRPSADILPHSDALRVIALDVTDPLSIAAAIEAAGPIDVLVNNAGIGCAGAFEATPMTHVRRIFETNTFGVMAMTQAVIPQMRDRRAGVIVNVTSTATLAPMPLVSVYTASKQAIQGFTGSLALELAHFGVTAKLVEPGYGPTTRFGQNNPLPAQTMIPAEYGGYAGEVFGGFVAPMMTTAETDVAEAVWTAVHDRAGRLRFPAGADAEALANGI
jgi:NAD(P)-dependent dehydrogenase (short-subunit alcohol dehydrogenase family)